MRRKIMAIAGLVSLWTVEAPAQQAAAGPPQVLVVTREQFRPGSMEAHNKQVPAFYALFDKAKAGTYRVGLVPMSGDQNHILYLEGHTSFAEMEAANKRTEAAIGGSPALQAEMDALTKQNGPLHESQRSSIAVLRSDLSYHPNTMDQVARARYVTISVTRVQPGRGPDYSDYVRQTNAAREKAKLDEHSTVYQVSTGAAAGTFLTFVSSRSLAETDAFVQGQAERTRKLNDALGGEMVVKQRREALPGIVAETMPTLYAVDRSLSRPSPEFAAYDPEYWTPKKEAPKKEPARK